MAEVLAARLSRRRLLSGGAAAAALAATMGGVGGLVGAAPAAAHGRSRRGDAPLLGFVGIAPSTADTVVVPPGYSWEVLIAWGDPVSSGPSFAPDASNSAADQERQWGMHNDGLVYFPFAHKGSRRGLLVQNHEYTDDGLLFPDGVANWTAEKTRKSQAAHGVSVIEVERTREGWQVRRPSRYARRITAYTPITMGGPAAGHELLRTAADPSGTRVLGTINNCAMGFTPWGTYLACEENFNGYFRKTAPFSPLESRYGIGATSGYLWHTTDKRFDLDVERNEANRFGWVTEFNPFNPRSTPVKRTALGRMKHEGAWVEETDQGRVVVYMGDDERFEYIYRYVSTVSWRTTFSRGGHPLDEGTLYAARFDADGRGEWLPLTTENPRLSGFASQAEILVNARAAADAAGATKMDRPEWIDTIPGRKEVYVTLTNNNRRGTGTNPAADVVNPRPNNVYGHILRWRYAHDFDDPTFEWDILGLAGDPDTPAHGATFRGDKFGSPDGLYVAPSGRLWVQTDVSTSTINKGDYAGFGNNQMLGVDPDTAEARRFLVGPNQCEITGLFVTPDERTMFVGIQHPGETPDDTPNDPANPARYSSFPDGGRPRSCLIVVTKDDGGVIGS